MRLIDADALIKELEEVHKIHSPIPRGKDDLFRMYLVRIMEQPTTYDVERVVKQLENMRDNASRNIKLNSQSYDIKHEVECNEKHYNKIIEIIRNGEQK